MPPLMKTPPTVSNFFAVLGSPISHSQSPKLHGAAIAALGIDARYTAREVTEAQFSDFMVTEGQRFSGFSLTMPLKHVARQVAIGQCHTAVRAGAINTLVNTPEGWWGYNTDVWGARTAIERNLGTDFESAAIIGAGATAASLAVALIDSGISTIRVLARDESKATNLAAFINSLGGNGSAERLGAGSVQVDLVANTLPGSVQLDPSVIDDLDAAALFDVVYDPWPTGLAREWTARGLPVTSGIHMLLWQAVRQARVFYGESVDEELPDEIRVITAMRSAVGL